MFKWLRKPRLPLLTKIKVTFSQKFFQIHLAILNFHFDLEVRALRLIMIISEGLLSSNKNVTMTFCM